jgi:hypothetical protein
MTIIDDNELAAEGAQALAAVLGNLPSLTELGLSNKYKVEDRPK